LAIQGSDSEEEEASEDEHDYPNLDPDWEEEPPHPEAKFRPHRANIMDESWDFWYRRSPTWKDSWLDITGVKEGEEWPKDIRISKGKMYHREKMCVPEGIVLKLVQAQHRLCGHLGVDRLFEECTRRFAFPKGTSLKVICGKVKKACGPCAQCDPPSRRRYGKIGRFPIPMRIWDSVSMDIFSMPEERQEGQRFDAMIVCVDRHTGWIIAVPTQKEGLTAEKVAKIMLQKWIDLRGGVPSTITSDQGTQFVGAWFTSMCARMGIRQAFSQPYRPRPIEGRKGREDKFWTG
jgi:hypothetical protein